MVVELHPLVERYLVFLRQQLAERQEREERSGDLFLAYEFDADRIFTEKFEGLLAQVLALLFLLLLLFLLHQLPFLLSEGQHLRLFMGHCCSILNTNRLINLETSIYIYEYMYYNE